jgi:hypothetical protein
MPEESKPAILTGALQGIGAVVVAVLLWRSLMTQRNSLCRLQTSL